MAEPLRNNEIPFQSITDYTGMYIVEESNAKELPIPHLPLLTSTTNSNVESIPVCNKPTIDSENEIACKDLFTNFSTGDIVWIDNRRKLIKSILSKHSNSNTLLLTEQCENRCSFCSQPPNNFSDTHLYNNALLALLNYNTDEFIGLSGGEPTKNKKSFIYLLNSLNEFNIPTKLHVLTHGRNFSDKDFTSLISMLVEKRIVLWGIPIYGHRSSLHDNIVNSEGALVDTLQGLAHICEYGLQVEVRIVSCSNNIAYLPDIVNFIANSFMSLKTISIMNMEPKGLARKHYKSLYVPIKKQNKYILKAIDYGIRYGLDIRLFNYPLCLLDLELRSYAAKSISDWKNYYPHECSRCKLKNQCGGFFTSATGNFIETIEAQL